MNLHEKLLTILTMSSIKSLVSHSLITKNKQEKKNQIKNNNTPNQHKKTKTKNVATYMGTTLVNHIPSENIIYTFQKAQRKFCKHR